MAALASQVLSIISYFSGQSARRAARWRALCEKEEAEARAPASSPKEELVEEMRYLDLLRRNENKASTLFDLGLSLLSFLSFWLLGAMVFHFTEVRRG